MSKYLLESFEEFCEGQDFIIEAAESSELKDMKAAYERTKKAFAALQDAASDLKSACYYFESNAPTPESKKHAEDAYNHLKGNFNYVLNGDLDKYFDYASESIDKAIKGATAKAVAFKVRVPKEADFTSNELQIMLRAIGIDKPGADRQMYYERGSYNVMLKSRSGGAHSGNATSTSEIRSIMRDVLDFLKDGNDRLVKKWVKFMKENTGYTFRFTGGYSDYLYIEW